MTRTKIVCTIGPASQSEPVVRGMLSAGMDVARINFSHGERNDHARNIRTLRRLAEERGQSLAVLADLQGPKLRVGDLPGGALELTEGTAAILSTASGAAAAGHIPLPHPELIPALQPGQRVLLDDGALELRLDSKHAQALHCTVIVGGTLLSRKGLNLPGAALAFSALTEKDRADALFAAEAGVDYLALSFVRRAADVHELRTFLAGAGVYLPIVAKIEKPEALEAFEDVLAATDAVMVARGDLGVEIPPEQVPLHQKRILRACNRAGKPAITATQMLQSMIDNPRPTRAEASDVANAVLDGSDAVMLSGETAIGRYPVESVRMMERVVQAAEGEIACQDWLARVGASGGESEAIARATVEVALELRAAAILVSTLSGYTARMVARYRPEIPVIAATPEPDTYRRMALVWGVRPLQVPRYDTTDAMFAVAARAAVEAGLLQPGQRVVISAGIPAGGPGRTNMLKVHEV